MRLRDYVLAALFVLAPCVGLAQDTRPNILLIVADDLGYADLGVFGGDIRTPNIGALAARGLLFTQFHTAPLCAPTRAMLLTGNNNHVAGIGRQDRTPASLTFGMRGHEGRLSDRVMPFPSLLRDAGYRTYMAGKWHLGYSAKYSPVGAGFDRSFVTKEGYANHFNAVGATPEGSVYWEDGVSVPWPEGAYSTELYTDKLIEYLEGGKDSGRPFFVYAAYTSPHWPLQVPSEDLDLYKGKYDSGYDALREQRFRSLQGAAIIPRQSTLPPRNDAVTPWRDLSRDEKRRESRKMELYAAMLDNLDRNVGRLLDYLRANDLYDDTLIVFMSDNGAAGEDFFNVGRFRDFLHANYDNSYENMGHASSWVSYGPQWAEAGSAPYKRYKGFTTEGGIVAPMIMAGAGLGPRHGISHEYLTVTDLAPTFLELARARYPIDKAPMTGESLWPYLSGQSDTIHDSDFVTVLYHAGRSFLRQGDWKIVNIEQPFDEGHFALYNVVNDPGETTDLSAMEPERRTALIALWRAERRKLGIVLPEDL